MRRATSVTGVPTGSVSPVRWKRPFASVAVANRVPGIETCAATMGALAASVTVPEIDALCARAVAGMALHSAATIATVVNHLGNDGWRARDLDADWWRNAHRGSVMSRPPRGEDDADLRR